MSGIRHSDDSLRWPKKKALRVTSLWILEGLFDIFSGLTTSQTIFQTPQQIYLLGSTLHKHVSAWFDANSLTSVAPVSLCRPLIYERPNVPTAMLLTVGTVIMGIFVVGVVQSKYFF